MKNFFGQATNFFGEVIDTVGDVVGAGAEFVTSLPGRLYDAGDRIQDELTQGSGEARQNVMSQEIRRMFGNAAPLLAIGAVGVIGALLLSNK